jgi:hypothetical protein
MPQAMDLGPLAQPLFYQYKCIYGSAKASCINESDGFCWQTQANIQPAGHNQSPGLLLASQSSAGLLEYLAPQPRACPHAFHPFTPGQGRRAAAAV